MNREQNKYLLYFTNDIAVPVNNKFLKGLKMDYVSVNASL